MSTGFQPFSVSPPHSAPLPHNALHVRITESETGDYRLEVSQDQLLWFPMPDSYEDRDQAISEAQLILHSQKYPLALFPVVIWEDGRPVSG